MGCVRDLFQTKPGGTLFGNILRGVGDHFTGGVYSAIFPRPPMPPVNYRSALPSGLIGFGDPRNTGTTIFNTSSSGTTNRPSVSISSFGLPPFVPTEDFGTASNSFTNVFNAPSDAPVGIMPNMNDINIIPSTDSNPYGLPSHIMNLVNNVLDHIDDGLDIEDIPNSLIDTLDDYFVGNPAAGLLESFGIDFSTGQVQDSALLHQTTGVAVNPWDVQGTIGGVDFNIGSEEQDTPTPTDQESFLDKAKTWVNNNVGATIGIVSALVLGVGFLIYKRYNRY